MEIVIIRIFGNSDSRDIEVQRTVSCDRIHDYIVDRGRDSGNRCDCSSSCTSSDQREIREIIEISHRLRKCHTISDAGIIDNSSGCRSLSHDRSYCRSRIDREGEIPSIISLYPAETTIERGECDRTKSTRYRPKHWDKYISIHEIILQTGIRHIECRTRDICRTRRHSRDHRRRIGIDRSIKNPRSSSCGEIDTARWCEDGIRCENSSTGSRDIGDDRRSSI